MSADLPTWAYPIITAAGPIEPGVWTVVAARTAHEFVLAVAHDEALSEDYRKQVNVPTAEYPLVVRRELVGAR